MDERAQRIAERLDVPVLVVVFAAVPLLVAQSLDLPGTWGDVLDVVNWVIWSVFLLELVVMLAIVPDRAAWARANVLDIAIVVLTPPFLGGDLEALWALRLLRIIDVLPILGGFMRVNGFRYAAIIAFVAVLGGGLAYADLETTAAEPINGFDGIWWAFVTVTTTGYGDYFPTSVPGRLLAMGLMAIGPVLLGLIAGTASVLAERRIQEQVGHVQDEIGVDVARLDAEVSGVEREVERVEDEVDAVTGQVAGMREVDRTILQALESLSSRLSHLEELGEARRGGDGARGG